MIINGGDDDGYTRVERGIRAERMAGTGRVSDSVDKWVLAATANLTCYYPAPRLALSLGSEGDVDKQWNLLQSSRLRIAAALA